jgi:hypothetical protein
MKWKARENRACNLEKLSLLQMTLMLSVLYKNDAENKTLHIILISFLLTACAYAQTGDSLTIKYNYINSIPQNAKFIFNDSLAGETLFALPLNRLICTNPLQLLKLDGYLDYSFMYRTVIFRLTNQ